MRKSRSFLSRGSTDGSCLLLIIVWAIASFIGLFSLMFCFNSLAPAWLGINVQLDLLGALKLSAISAIAAVIGGIIGWLIGALVKATFS